MCNFHVRSQDPEPEEKESTLSEYLTTEKPLVFKYKRCVHSQVLSNCTDELVAKKETARVKVQQSEEVCPKRD